jgi:hypothetical protein
MDHAVCVFFCLEGVNVHGIHVVSSIDGFADAFDKDAVLRRCVWINVLHFVNEFLVVGVVQVSFDGEDCAGGGRT